jgi:pyridoxine 5'-phosphate synthase PdxJ
MNSIKKHANEIQLKYNALQQEYECDKKKTAQLIESYSDKYTNSEQKLIKALQTIVELESKLVTLKEEQEKKLKEIQGMLNNAMLNI